MLITSPNWFFVSIQILVGSSWNQNTLPALTGSWETRCCMSATDAYYWFTLWPRKQLIAYAEAAWHLTIHCGERDDWIAHISAMEHPLDCVHIYVCVCVCVCVWLYRHTVFSVSSLFCWNVAAVIWLFSLTIAVDSVLSQLLFFYDPTFHGSWIAIFNCNIKSSYGVTVLILTPSIHLLVELTIWPWRFSSVLCKWWFLLFFMLKCGNSPLKLKYIGQSAVLYPICLLAAHWQPMQLWDQCQESIRTQAGILPVTSSQLGGGWVGLTRGVGLLLKMKKEFFRIILRLEMYSFF